MAGPMKLVAALALALASLVGGRPRAGTAAGAARRRPRWSSAPRTSRARRSCRRSTARASRQGPGHHVQDRPRSHRGRVPRAAPRRHRRLRRLPGHPARLPRRHPDGRPRRDVRGACRPSSPAPASWRGSPRPQSTRTGSTSPPRPPRSTTSPRSPTSPRSRRNSCSARLPSARSGRCASARRRRRSTTSRSRRCRSSTPAAPRRRRRSPAATSTSRCSSPAAA